MNIICVDSVVSVLYAGTIGYNWYLLLRKIQMEKYIKSVLNMYDCTLH